MRKKFNKLTARELKHIEVHEKKMRERQFENALAESAVRARSVTVGTAFGGVSEITMRRPDGTVVFAILQPVEVVELIHQMAANIGCHMHMEPRQDFAAWRAWKHTPQELEHFRGKQTLPGVGHPPHVKEITFDSRSAPLPPPDQQPGLALPPPKDSNETVATEKPHKRHRAKRAATSS